MNLDPSIAAALIAGVVSVVGVLISYFSSRSTVRSNVSALRHEVEQTQFQDVIAKRIELYPKLWRIHIHYETNWDLEEKPKTREWAQQYVTELNDFNLEGGVFFSQDLYEKFFDLRFQLYEAIKETEPNSTVSPSRAKAIREVVYGTEGEPGLSTHLKDDLGSYRSVTLQRRLSAL
jgi:hypothetical protein